MCICRRSWDEMGGANVWMIDVKVGRARVRSSPPRLSLACLIPECEVVFCIYEKDIPRPLRAPTFPLTCSAHFCASSFL